MGSLPKEYRQLCKPDDFLSFLRQSLSLPQVEKGARFALGKRWFHGWGGIERYFVAHISGSGPYVNAQMVAYVWHSFPKQKLEENLSPYTARGERLTVSILTDITLGHRILSPQKLRLELPPAEHAQPRLVQLIGPQELQYEKGLWKFKRESPEEPKGLLEDAFCLS